MPALYGSASPQPAAVAHPPAATWLGEETGGDVAGFGHPHPVIAIHDWSRDPASTERSRQRINVAVNDPPAHSPQHGSDAVLDHALKEPIVTGSHTDPAVSPLADF